MSKKVEIKTCDDCPHFDNEYYDYTHTCYKLDRMIENSDQEGYSIPKDCPLEDWVEKEVKDEKG